MCRPSITGTSSGGPTWLPAGFRVLLLLGVLLAAGSCLFRPSDILYISGRLGSDFGCLTVREGDRTYETSFRDLPVPPLDSYVLLKVRRLRGTVSVCMVGEMVEVLRVVRVVTDFRTAPVTGAETWSRAQGPIVLGKVEVMPGAVLTILPGTIVHIVGHGELRVRGILRMVGTAADSVRILGAEGFGPGAGPVVLDSARAGTQVAFASVGLLSIRGAAPEVRDITAAGITVENGSVPLRHLRTGRLGVWEGSASAESADLGAVDAIYGILDIAGCTMGRLDLSYSRANVRDCRLQGDLTYVMFHGPSGGSFERNAFRAAETIIEVRHTSDPVFRSNNFLSPSFHVICGSYQLPGCISMEQNWWGTTDEQQIRSRIEAGCPVCYAPWLDGPAGGLHATRLAAAAP